MKDEYTRIQTFWRLVDNGGKIKIFVTYNGQSKLGKKLLVLNTKKEIVF